MLGIYCRISKRKAENTDLSIESQKEHGINLAKSLGLDYKVYKDEGISGQKDEEYREGFLEMINDIKANVITNVYCYDQSRIERSSMIWGYFVTILMTNNVKFYNNNGFIDLNTPENRLTTAVISATNQFMAQMTGKKVKLAINQNAKNGKTHGLNAYGYYRGEDGKYAINEEEAKVVRAIFDMSIDGIGTYTIATKLNNENIQTKFNSFTGSYNQRNKESKTIFKIDKSKIKWRGSVVWGIIKNTIYKGFKKWNSDFIPVPPIVDEETWEKANINLNNNKKNAGKNEEYKYLLNGILFCQDCGNLMKGKRHLKARTNTYKCKSKNIYGNTCTNSRAISIPKLETFIIKHLFETTDLKTHLDNLATKSDESNIYQYKLVEVLKKIVENQKKITNLINLTMSGTYDDSTSRQISDNINKIETENKQLLSQKYLLEKEIDEIEKNKVKRAYQSQIQKYTSTLDFHDIKKLVFSIIDRIEIKHIPYENKGNFYITIKYKGFEVTSVFTTDWDSLQWLWLYKLQRANVTVETIIKENESDIDWFNTEIKDEILDSIREDLKKGKGKSIFKRSDIKNLNYKIGLALLYSDDSEERILEDAKHEIIDIDNNNLVNFI